MKIRKKHDGKMQDVKVAEEACKTKPCLRIGYYTHYTACGSSGCSYRTDDRLSCLTRDNHGCPESLPQPQSSPNAAICPYCGRRNNSALKDIRTYHRDAMCESCGRLFTMWLEHRDVYHTAPEEVRL